MTTAIAMVLGMRYESYYYAPRLSTEHSSAVVLLRGRFIDLTNCANTNVSRSLLSLLFVESFRIAIPRARSSKNYRRQITIDPLKAFSLVS